MEKKNSMKILVCGRSGAGKDHLGREMEKLGLTGIKSYTTRPKRSEDEDTHVFITPEEAAQFTERAAETVINGYEYFATKAQVEEADFYIIDPAGIKNLAETMPDTCFFILYIRSDAEKRREMAVRRGADQAVEAEVYAKRTADEDAQFSGFERMLEGQKGWLQDFPNICGTKTAVNDYKGSTLRETAKQAVTTIKRHRAILDLIPAMADEGIIGQEGDRIPVYTRHDRKLYVSHTVFSGMLICSPEARVRVFDALLDHGLIHAAE